MEIHPSWAFVTENLEGDTSGEEIAAADVQRSIIFHTFTIGPSAAFPGSYEHWNLLRDDLSQAIGLGWIPDAALASTLVGQLASARQALDANDGTLAKSRLQELLDTLAQSTPDQRRQEAHDLVLLNVQKLIEKTPDTPIPFEPKVTLSPLSSSLPIGTDYTLTATAVNLGDPNQAPIADFKMEFLVTKGPNQGLKFSGVTDAQGKLHFSYTSTKLGTDKILVGLFEEVPTTFGSAEVTWTGGPDLTIGLFLPPVIQTEGGRPITITEITVNEGILQAGVSKTRYFISEDDIIDPDQDRPIGEREVSLLAAGEESDGGSREIILPGDLEAGSYYLGACADADRTVVELNELNNCSVNQIVVPLERVVIEDLVARAKDSKVDLVWTPVQGAFSYNIYRSTTSGGPYGLIKSGHVTDYATYLDLTVTNGVTYYYIVRWLDGGGQESPDSNEATATPVSGRTRR